MPGADGVSASDLNIRGERRTPAGVDRNTPLCMHPRVGRLHGDHRRWNPRVAPTAHGHRGTIRLVQTQRILTIQGNLVTMGTLLASACFIVIRKKQPTRVIYLRAVATTIIVIVIVGLVYNSRPAGAALRFRWC